jgi:hypothetical protein
MARSLGCVVLLCSVAVCAMGMGQEGGAAPPVRGSSFETVTIRGRVGWLADVLARRHGVQQVVEAAERVLVLETSAGELHPLIEDVRGRSFRRDARLRQFDVELVARRHHGSPFVQVVQVFELRKDGKYSIDYWCDICAIIMYELKDCDCCQGPIELRRTRSGE